MIYSVCRHRRKHFKYFMRNAKLLPWFAFVAAIVLQAETALLHSRKKFMLQVLCWMLATSKTSRLRWQQPKSTRRVSAAATAGPSKVSGAASRHPSTESARRESTTSTCSSSTTNSPHWPQRLWRRLTSCWSTGSCPSFSGPLFSQRWTGRTAATGGGGAEKTYSWPLDHRRRQQVSFRTRCKFKHRGEAQSN